jgi:glycosyltransferase involved in cell wall biosynthesis
MRVWLVTAAEPIPSDGVRPMRFMGLARALARRGHDVTVWTQTFFHHTKRHRFPADTEYVAEGYRVVVLRAFGYRTNVSLRRYASHWRFARRLAAAMPARPAPDVVVASLPPLDTAAAVADYCARRAIPFVVDVIDPWPDVFVDLLPPALQPAGRVVSSPLRRRATRIVRSAHTVTAISRRYAAWAEGLAAPRPVATAVFHPAVQLGSFDPRARDPHDPGPLRVVYAGALGRAYDVDCVIDCARLLAAEGAAVEVAVAGDGPERARLERRAAGLTNVRFLGWLEAPALARLLAASDLGLACYRRDATQTVTYKLFEYAAAGLPVVCSLEGEMADMIRAAGVGASYRAEDPADLVRVLRTYDVARDELGRIRRRARAFAEAHGDAERVYGAMAELTLDAARPRWRANA